MKNWGKNYGPQQTWQKLPFVKTFLREEPSTCVGKWLQSFG